MLLQTFWSYFFKNASCNKTFIYMSWILFFFKQILPEPFITLSAFLRLNVCGADIIKQYVLSLSVRCKAPDKLSP